MTTPADATTFFVVVPYFDEESGILATLKALAAQSDRRFSLVLVDNGSRDHGPDVVAGFAARHPWLTTYLIDEAQKGTGAAADTGFRFAIDRGARWIARTDADCLPRVDWVGNLKRALCEEGLDFVAGKIRPREDEGPLSLRWRIALKVMIWLAENHGKVVRRGPEFRYPYFLAVGNNLAIAARLYELAGGFPRTAVEEQYEDRVLSERVRTLTDKAALRRDVVVYNSARRVRAWGFINTLRWYRNHGYHPPQVDVR